MTGAPWRGGSGNTTDGGNRRRPPRWTAAVIIGVAGVEDRQRQPIRDRQVFGVTRRDRIFDSEGDLSPGFTCGCAGQGIEVGPQISVAPRFTA